MKIAVYSPYNKGLGTLGFRIGGFYIDFYPLWTPGLGFFMAACWQKVWGGISINGVYVRIEHAARRQTIKRFTWRRRYER